MTTVFWFSVGFVAYVYAGYPLLLALWARTVRAHREPGEPYPQRPPYEPRVSIVIAARGEAARLAARIENLLSLDYPSDRRQIIVVSDGPDDETRRVLQRYPGIVDGVEVPAGGKALALNAGVARARHEIVVFADARQTFANDALRALTRPFGDAAIGGVTGELLLDAEAALFDNRRVSSDRRQHPRPGVDRRRTIASTIADGVGLYWRYEKALRRCESAVGSTLGATGAIYAIRRELWQPLPANTILDDVLTPMRIVLSGRRVIFEEGARAFDRAASDADAEARRKIRTLAGNFQLITLEPRLLLPWRNPVWLQFTSHKLGRLAVPYALLAAFTASLALSTSPLYAVALALQVAFYLLAGYGAWIERSARGRAAAAAPAVSAALAAREVA